MDGLVLALGVPFLRVALPDEGVVVLLLLRRVYVAVVVVGDVLLPVAGREGVQIELVAVDLLRRWLLFPASLGQEELSNGVGLVASAAVREVGVDCLADLAVFEGGRSLQDGAEKVRLNRNLIP